MFLHVLACFFTFATHHFYVHYINADHSEACNSVEELQLTQSMIFIL